MAELAKSFEGRPEEVALIDAGISDARQAEYQRRMSMLLAGHGLDNVTSEANAWATLLSTPVFFNRIAP